MLIALLRIGFVLGGAMLAAIACWMLYDSWVFYDVCYLHSSNTMIIETRVGGQIVEPWKVIVFGVSAAPVIALIGLALIVAGARSWSSSAADDLR